MSKSINFIPGVNTTSLILTIIYAILFGLLISAYVTSIQLDIPVGEFTRDPAATFQTYPLIGVISNLGILLWCTTASVCLFTYMVHFSSSNIVVRQFLLTSGLFTTVLLFDDLFMLHEFVMPDVLGIPEAVIYSSYLVFILIYLIKYRAYLLKTEYMVLIIACGFFSLSILSDVYLPQTGIVYLVEDGFKLFGIATWTLYFISTCFVQMRKNLLY